MERPKRSKFMGQYFKIEYVQKIIDHDDPSKTVYGQLDDENSVINIENGMHHERERDTLIHETLHQMLNKSGIRWKDDKQEEEVIEFLGSAILSHIRDNKKFWAYVMEPPPDEGEE